MPELRPHHDPAGVMATPPSPRAVLLWDGTYWRAVRGHTDGTVQVRGEDQLHSYVSPLQVRAEGVISGAGGYMASSTPPDGQVWVVTRVSVSDRTSPTTAHGYGSLIEGTTDRFGLQTAAFAIGDFSFQPVRLWMEHDDYILVWFTGGLVNDAIWLTLFGHRMTKE